MSRYRSELQRFDELRPEVEALDPRTLTAARLAIRPEKEKAAFDEIRKAFPGKLPVFAHSETVHIVDHDLNESSLENQFRKQQKQQTMLRQPQPRASGSKKKQQDSHESL